MRGVNVSHSCTTTVGRSGGSGLGALLVVAFLIVAYIIGKGRDAIVGAADPAVPAEPPPPQVIVDPTPWWGPWLVTSSVIVIVTAVIALAALVIARLNYRGKVLAAELGYAGNAGPLHASPAPPQLPPRPAAAAVGPGVDVIDVVPEYEEVRRA